MGTEGGVHHRSMGRINVGWDAVAKCKGEDYPGRVIDLSVDGGFFALAIHAPAESGEDAAWGYTQKDARPELLEALAQGDKSTIDLPVSPGQSGHYQVTIKWVGFSESHSLWGFGFAFTSLGLG